MNQRISKLLTFAALAISSSLAMAQESAVRDNSPHHWGMGIFVGRPQKASLKGILFNTYELEVGFGNFTQDPRYIGSAANVSTESRSIFEEFQRLDHNQVYIFRYVQKFALDPEIEDSHTQIVAIRPLRTNFASTGLPHEMRINRGRSASYSSGSRVGRIVDVLRWGYGFRDQVCTMTIEMGGIRTSAEGHADTNTTEMNIYSEQGCVYAENILRYGMEVEVQYDQDMIEVWDSADYIVRSIKVIADAAGVSVDQANPAAQPVVAPFDEAAYTRYRDRLIHDPVFMQELTRRLQQGQ